MRKEFILVLLGIISISTFSSLLSGYMQTNTNKVLLDTVVGLVGAGNFSYWQLGHNGPLLVELTSLTGDADIYVSDSIRPSYEIDRNNFSSATCGPDLVNIPSDFPRPIGIGVFGHWSHFISDYSIQVFLDTSAPFTDGKANTIDHGTFAKPERPDAERKTREKPVLRKNEGDHKSFFLKILNMLDLVFDMFIL